MSGEPLAERAAAAVRLIVGMPPRRRVLVLADADVDGVAAAAVLARALARVGQRFVVRLSRRRDPAFLDALIAEEPALLITADLGASFVPRLKQAHVPAIVLDHHEPAGDGDGETVVHVNPHLVNEDGSTTASGAAVAFVFADALLADAGLSAADLLPFALLGAWGDRYHGASHDSGLHARLWRRASHAVSDAERVEWQPWRPGTGREEDLATALAHQLDPMLPRLAGDIDAARDALRRLGVDPMTHPDALDGTMRARLASWLVAAGLEAGAEPGLTLDALAPRPAFAASAALARGLDVAAVALRIDAATRRGAESTALAALLGSSEAWNDLEEGLDAYRDAVLQPARRAALAPESAPRSGPARIVRIPDGRYSGPVADRLMAWTGFGDAPVVVLGPAPPGTKVSLRARPAPAGVRPWRLDEAAGLAARVAGGVGGGHRLAAGAIVPAEKEAQFLERLGTALGGDAGTARIEMHEEEFA